MKHCLAALAALAALTLCSAPLLAQAQGHCASPNADGDYILGEVDGVASAMHWPSGLVWKRCSEGQTFSGGQCSDTATARGWNGWVQNQALLPLSFIGQTDWGIDLQLSQNLLASGAWRMAYVSELQEIAANCESSPFVNPIVFPADPTSLFWSGSPSASSKVAAWAMRSVDGSSATFDHINGLQARLVRGGQPFAPLATPTAQSAAAGAQATFPTFALAPGTGAGQAWGGARISGDGNPQFQLNGAGGWLQQAIVRSGDQISVRLTAPASGANVATFTLHSGQTTGTSANASNGGLETTALQETAVNFSLSALAGLTPVDGVCGSAHGTPQPAQPTQDGSLCSSGISHDLLPTGTGWTWTCNGQAGGASASCQAPQGFVVTPAAQANGSISPDTPATVAWGTRLAFTITPAAGHRATASGCGGSLAGSTYTTGAIVADCTVSASFAPIPAYAISTTVSPAGAGSVTCAPNPVPHGSAATCRALSSAHALTAWGGDCAGQSGPLCSLANVTEAKTATAQFDASRITPRALNDTGVLASGAAGSGNASTCDPAHPSGQDCHYGRDAGAALGQLAKQGASASTANGFDYTKIANDGSELPATAALGSGSGDWACTRDNVTGLVWEVKTANPNNLGADLRDAGYLYTWYDPHSPDGDSGVQNPNDDCQTQGRCTTSQFVQDVNAAGLCGARDWRLPSVQELESLLDLGRASAVQPPGSALAPAIDPDYFPNTPLLPLWSSTPLADHSLLGTPSAWFVDFDLSPTCGAGACVGERLLSLGVRLVRGGQ